MPLFCQFVLQERVFVVATILELEVLGFDLVSDLRELGDIEGAVTSRLASYSLTASALLGESRSLQLVLSQLLRSMVCNDLLLPYLQEFPGRKLALLLRVSLSGQAEVLYVRIPLLAPSRAEVILPRRNKMLRQLWLRPLLCRLLSPLQPLLHARGATVSLWATAHGRVGSLTRKLSPSDASALEDSFRAFYACRQNSCLFSDFPSVLPYFPRSGTIDRPETDLLFLL